MKQGSWKWLFTWEGRVQRGPYLLAGSILTVIKYGIDSLVAAHFGQTWQIWNYVLPGSQLSVFELGQSRPEMYAILWAIAIPFFWVGIALTLRRLRDAGDRPAWIFLFFVPLANLLLFLWLTLVPSTAKPITEATAAAEPRPGNLRTEIVGVAIAVVLGVALAVWGIQVLFLYGWGLFLGIPFFTGFVASWFLNIKKTRSSLSTIAVSALVPALIGTALLSLGREGLGCLLMAVPLTLPFSIAGGLMARSILQRRSQTIASPNFAACVAILPLAMFAEHAAKFDPPVIAVTTGITIDAPASVVWRNVIAFPPLAPPQEWLFRAGIAYPTSGQIVGSGPGAVRYCHFSTGDFIEPITVWDEDRLLAFDVSSQAPAMQELSPWKITPPHIGRNYMRSRHGQFRLVALSDQRTLLEGTTWYQNYFWPQAYWRLWSDEIVHQIHLRVLRHVKQQAEAR
ncbi:MAG TPA: DUF805 domain-containing protein [Terriglobales bacterium]|nr:DUF805 domain-containing protein [Terriglobales bacterium]